MSTLGEQLENKHKTLYEKLQESNFNKIINNIKNKLDYLLDVDNPIFEIEIPLKDLNINPDDVRSEKSSLYQKLKSWSSSEKLNLSVHWIHPDCSYCESCGGGCKPNSIYINWKL